MGQECIFLPVTHHFTRILWVIICSLIRHWLLTRARLLSITLRALDITHCIWACALCYVQGRADIKLSALQVDGFFTCAQIGITSDCSRCVQTWPVSEKTSTLLNIWRVLFCVVNLKWQGCLVQGYMVFQTNLYHIYQSVARLKNSGKSFLTL